MQAEHRGLAGPGAWDFTHANRQHDNRQQRRDEARQHRDLKGGAGQVGSAPLIHPDDVCRSRKSDKRPGCIPRTMNTERQPALFLVDAAGYQCITRRGADALADPVHETDSEHPSPGIGKIKEGFGECRETVTGDHQEFPFAQLIRERAGVKFDKAGRSLSHTFDQADDRCTHAEHVGEEQGNQVDDHLRGDVGQERPDSNDPHIARQAAPAFFIFHGTPKRQDGVGCSPGQTGSILFAEIAERDQHPRNDGDGNVSQLRYPTSIIVFSMIISQKRERTLCPLPACYSPSPLSPPSGVEGWSTRTRSP